MPRQHYNHIDIFAGEIGLLTQNFLSIKQSLVLFSTAKRLYTSDLHAATINKCLVNIKTTDYEIDSYLTRLKNLLPFIKNIRVPTIEYLKYFRNSPLHHIEIEFFYNNSLNEVIDHKELRSIDIDGLTDTKLLQLSALERLNHIKSNRCLFNFKHWLTNTNLKKLELSYSYILEFNQIYMLDQLEVLVLNDVQKSACGVYEFDYSKLAHLKKLRCLNLANNGVVEVEFLNSLVYLVRLELQRNLIEDVSGIGLLFNLEFLNIGGNLIVNIPDLSQMKKLKRLILNNNRLKDLSGICGLKSLKYLELQDNLIENVDCLTEVKQLVQLDLSKNWLTGIDLGFKLENLVMLDISFNRIRNLYGIGVCRDTVVFDDHQTRHI
jgi:Leucine-rich repeat (LRR) protein